MKKGDCVRLEKLIGNPTSSVSTPRSKDYRAGEVNLNMSLPIGYSMEGILRSEIEIGEPLIMIRFKRNDENHLGITKTSPLVSVESNILITENSLYKITQLADNAYVYPFEEQ